MSYRQARFWFFVEAGLAFLSTLVTLLVLWRRDWIEALIGTDPDRHSGALEWLIAIGLATATLVLTKAAWRQRRHLRVLAATDLGQDS
jgi:hypothetical protein